MENEKGKNLLIVALIVIIIALATMLVLVLNGTLVPPKHRNNNENNNVTKNENIKIDNTKEYVYDANYSYDNEFTQFMRPNSLDNDTKTIDRYGIPVTYTNGMQYLSNLKVPYININSNDAKTANNEIETLYIENAKQFDECAKDEIISCTQILTYRTYLSNDILSVVIINSIQQTSKYVLDYHIYNFDLITGNKLNYSQTLNKLGYDKDNTLSKIELLLKDKMNSIYDIIDNLETACYGDNKNCYEIANNLVKKSIDDESILFFVDNDSVLNILAIAYYDGVQNGNVDRYLIKIDK